MPAGSLFGHAVTGPGSTGGIKHLVEMRAGKMNLKGIVEDDLIIFPDDCEYVKVPQCTTGRVYLLKFKSSNRKFFFWLQEPHTDKDEDNCKRINEYLNNPSGTVPSQGGTDQDLQSLLNNMSQSQLMQLFGGGQMGGLSSLLGTISRPSTGGTRASNNAPAITHRTATTTPTTTTQANTSVTTPSTVASPSTPAGAAPKPNRTQRTTEASSSSSNPIQLADLQNFLQGLSPPTGANQQSVDLSTALNSDALSGLINNPEALEQLQSHLPAVDGNVQEQLRSTLASPQFQQAVSEFSNALESGQLAPVVSQLAVNPEAIAAAAQGNMQDFLKALEKTDGTGSSANNSGDKERDKSTKKEDKKDDDEGMQLD
ncbi:adhesion regulating membrane glycoprotein [Holotrichia oblita]|uniref:Adhesion regulating membrane glycoprotein n=1 Tax=Holotrichia oblita TaxID=644536 RepID=A0ACB9TM02_HOLOL|nr:adhesion regulating membrane glycoprotein [Holotrichia oblita]